MLTLLKELFLIDGMTAYQASEESDYDFKTVSNYFKEWADDIIETECHENWIDGEARIRTRSLEGTSMKLTVIRKRLSKLQIILDDLITLRTFTAPNDKLPAKIQKLINSLDSDKIDKLNQEIERYERIVRNNDILSSELQQQHDVLYLLLEELLAKTRRRIVNNDSLLGRLARLG